MTHTATAPILIVEDSPEDAEAAERALRRAGMALPIQRCTTGDEALDFLARRGPYGGAFSVKRPGLIILDLNLPGTDGREVLSEIKQHPELRSIPVVIFTTSGDERDVEACYRAGANSYIQKPVDVDGLRLAMQRVKEYWLEVVKLPLAD